MELPFYFLNSEEINCLDTTYRIYEYVTEKKDSLLKEDDYKIILGKLKKRTYLDEEEIEILASIITLVITSSEFFDDFFEIDTLKTKYILLKLITSHFKRLENDFFVDNGPLLSYIYKILKSSKKFIITNEEENYTYNFLKLLTL